MPSGEYPEELVELVTQALWTRANGRRLHANEPSPGRGTMYWLQARSVLDALSSAGRLVPDLSGSGGQPAHHCPDNGAWTLRARDLATMRRWQSVGGLNPEMATDLARQLAATLDHIRTHHLCEQCGYPLDRSTPHPDTPNPESSGSAFRETTGTLNGGGQPDGSTPHVRDSERRRP